EISMGRAHLIQRLDDGFRDAIPEIAARAQARFDCWVEKQEENHRPAEIAACRDDFLKTLDRMWWVHGDPPPETYIAYFDFDKSDRISKGRGVTEQVIADAHKRGTPNISVTGHTAFVGRADYNLRLSLRRADTIRAALIAGGIPAENIVTAGRGEG